MSRDFDVTPDGERFVTVVPVVQAGPESGPRPCIHVAVNWFEELKERVPS